MTWASLLSHSNSRTPFVCFLPCLLAIVLRLSNFFSHAMIGRRRRRWRVIKLRSRSVDRQHRFGLKRDSGVGEAILMCWGSPLPPPPSSSRRPRPPNVSECRSPEVPLAGGGGGGGSVGVGATGAAADRLMTKMKGAVAMSRWLLAADASVAAVVAAATGSRFRRRPPPRALGASVCRTGAAFSDLQSRGKHEAAARSTEATDGRTVWWRREEG